MHDTVRCCAVLCWFWFSVSALKSSAWTRMKRYCVCLYCSSFSTNLKYIYDKLTGNCLLRHETAQCKSARWLHRLYCLILDRHASLLFHRPGVRHGCKSAQCQWHSSIVSFLRGKSWYGDPAAWLHAATPAETRADSGNVTASSLLAELQSVVVCLPLLLMECV